MLRSPLGPRCTPCTCRRPLPVRDTFASPFRFPVASGTANGGTRSPPATPPSRSASCDRVDRDAIRIATARRRRSGRTAAACAAPRGRGGSRLAGPRPARAGAQARPWPDRHAGREPARRGSAPPRAARRSALASTSAAGSADQDAQQRHRQVDQRHEPEVAQHSDVRQRQDAEAGDRRRRPRRRPPRRCGCRRGAAPRSCRTPPALLAVALGDQHAELGRDRDHQRPQRHRHRVQGNPHDEQHQRRPAGRESDRRQRHERAAFVPAEGDEQHQRDRGKAGQQRLQAPPRVGDRAPDWAASTGRPTSCALHPRRRVQPRAHLFDHFLLRVQPHQADPERQRRRTAVGGDDVLGEVRRDRAEQAR